MSARTGAEERERLQGVWQLIPHERRSSGGVCRGRSASVCPKAHFELTGATLVALTRVDSTWAPLHRWHLAFEMREKAGAGIEGHRNVAMSASSSGPIIKGDFKLNMPA